MGTASDVPPNHNIARAWKVSASEDFRETEIAEQRPRCGWKSFANPEGSRRRIDEQDMTSRSCENERGYRSRRTGAGDQHIATPSRCHLLCRTGRGACLASSSVMKVARASNRLA